MKAVAVLAFILFAELVSCVPRLSKSEAKFQLKKALGNRRYRREVEGKQKKWDSSDLFGNSGGGFNSDIFNSGLDMFGSEMFGNTGSDLLGSDIFGNSGSDLLGSKTFGNTGFDFFGNTDLDFWMP